MATSVRIDLDKAGIGEFLKGPEVQGIIQAAVDRVAEQADANAARKAEADDRTLLRALDAARDL
jgi:D-alanyl-D-alanine dipeptidase